MKRRMLVGLFVGVMLLVSSGYMSDSTAGVNVGIGVNIQLPSVMLPGPPEVVVIPGTYVYFVPDIHENIFFYHGYWYRPYEEYWYRSKGYNGPWVYIRPAKVPSALINLPRNYRHLPPGYKHIPHRELKKNWRTWETNKYWDRPPLPSVMLPGPPGVVVIPGIYVYFVPGIDFDIFFYGGYWYRPYEGYWYRSKGYNGPWGYINTAKVPSALMNLPPNYRHLPPGYKHIPHHELNKNWRTWERNKYWDRKEYQRQDRRQDDLGRQRQDGRSDSLEPQEEGERRRGY